MKRPAARRLPGPSRVRAVAAVRANAPAARSSAASTGCRTPSSSRSCLGVLPLLTGAHRRGAPVQSVSRTDVLPGTAERLPGLGLLGASVLLEVLDDVASDVHQQDRPAVRVTTLPRW